MAWDTLFANAPSASSPAPTTTAGGWGGLFAQETPTQQVQRQKIASYNADTTQYADQAHQANSFGGLVKNTFSNIGSTVSNFGKGLVAPFTNPDPFEQSIENNVGFAKPIVAPVARLFAPVLEPLSKDIAAGIVFNTPLNAKFQQLAGQGAFNNPNTPQGTAGNALIGATQKTAPQVVGDTAQAVLAAYMPELFGKGFANFASQPIKQAIARTVTQGATYGLTFGTAQAASSGSKDPKEIASIVAQNTIGGALLNLATAGVTHGIFKSVPDAVAHFKVKQAEHIAAPNLMPPGDNGARETAPPTTSTADDYIQKFGNVVNTDNARELFPSYQADRTTSADVHEAASAVAKEAYQKLLDTRQGEGNNTVLYTAGGTGAGKTTAVGSLGNAGEFPIIYDTNMADPASAIEKIDQALGKGYDVEINYVHNDIHTSLDNALGRASRMEAEQGSGRTVPLDEHLKTHVNGPDSYMTLADHYADNPRVRFRAIDNEGNVPRPLQGDAIAFVDKKRYTGVNEASLYTQLENRVETAHENGAISSDIRRGFLGSKEQRQSGPKKDAGRVRPDGRGASKTQEVAPPAKGEGTTPSKIGKSIEQKAIEAGLTKGFDTTAGYDPTTFKEQAQLGKDLLDSGIENIHAVLRGEQPMPKGLREEGLIATVEAYLKEHPDAELSYALANSHVVSETSGHGQGLSLARMREPDSLTAKLKEAKGAKVKAAGGNERVTKNRTSLKGETKKVSLSKEDLSWGKFLDSITC